MGNPSLTTPIWSKSENRKKVPVLFWESNDFFSKSWWEKVIEFLLASIWKKKTTNGKVSFLSQKSTGTFQNSTGTFFIFCDKKGTCTFLQPPFFAGKNIFTWENSFTNRRKLLRDSRGLLGIFWNRVERLFVCMSQ